MAYIEEHARYYINGLDSVPCDVWYEKANTYIVVIGEDVVDYDGRFSAVAVEVVGYGLYKCKPRAVSYQYLDGLTLADAYMARQGIVQACKFYADNAWHHDESDMWQSIVDCCGERFITIDRKDVA